MTVWMSVRKMLFWRIDVLIRSWIKFLVHWLPYDYNKTVKAEQLQQPFIFWANQTTECTWRLLWIKTAVIAQYSLLLYIYQAAVLLICWNNLAQPYSTSQELASTTRPNHRGFLLAQPCILLPIPSSASGKGKWASGCMIFICQLGLNHNSILFLHYF